MNDVDLRAALSKSRLDFVHLVAMTLREMGMDAENSIGENLYLDNAFDLIKLASDIIKEVDND